MGLAASAARTVTARSLLEQALQRMNTTVTGAVVVVGMVAGWFAARQLGSQAMFLLIYGSAVGMILAFLVARRRLALKVSRSRISPRMRAGQLAEIEVSIQSSRRVSTIVVEEQMHPRLGNPVVIPIPALPAKGEVTHGYSFRPSLRGVYPLGPLTATWSDPFGLTSHRQVLLPAQDIVVHPPVERVRDRVLTRMWEDPPVRPPRSKPWPVGFEFYGVRDYVPGDDIRRVVWSVVAKTGKLMVRESEQGITDRVLILVDSNPEWHDRGDVSATFETAVRIAASVGVQHLRDGFSLSVRDCDRLHLQRLHGRRAELSLLDEMARIKLSKGTLSDALGKVHDEVRAGAHMLVVTPHLDQKAAARLRILIDRGSGIVVVLTVHDESDPVSVARAAALGCPVVQVPAGSSLEAAFSHLAGRGRR